MERNLAICVGIVLAADYLNHYDSVTLAAGDGYRANSLAQIIDPLNPNSQNAHIEGDGRRIAGVVQQYRGPANAAPAGGNCPKDGSMAADSSRCGGCSAESRPGGAT
ncbi:hypothetical protein [Mesorhizobium sp. LSHC412B00]|uniref:hypothetical protein n=1 Tax=Mesorhizobium sp. LSHC412B00 TaxID=1287285 RepID=UPI0003CECD8C|nr:hypothetical protein [Mesorhizobium sp. LSHC412B00]ESX81608.1 hypothetical protein X756_31950 [Mesorhizobium sp. LSHC412B00]